MSGLACKGLLTRIQRSEVWKAFFSGKGAKGGYIGMYQSGLEGRLELG